MKEFEAEQGKVRQKQRQKAAKGKGNRKAERHSTAKPSEGEFPEGKRPWKKGDGG